MVWMTVDRSWAPDPFRELARLRKEMDRVFDHHGMASPELPAINVWANQDEAVVTAEIPGINTDELSITVSGSSLTMAGERKPDSLAEEGTYHRKERGYGRFSRTVRLPFDVEADKVKATATNGIIEIRLPREEASKPRKIAIQAE